MDSNSESNPLAFQHSVSIQLLFTLIQVTMKRSSLLELPYLNIEELKKYGTECFIL